jgi:hypothetical protein
VLLLISEIRRTNGTMINLRQDILIQISAAREASNIDTRVAMLQTLNSSLPKGIRLTLPSMFTNAYVRRALETIEDKIINSI